MSTQIATANNVSKVACFVATLLNQGFNSFGFSAAESWYEAFKDCRRCNLYDEDLIYQALYNLNYKAYDGRYRHPIKDDYTKDFPKNPDVRFWNELTRKVECFGEYNCQEVVQPWHYQALKGMQYLHYQLDGDYTEKEPKVVALGAMIQRLAMFIACHTPVYHTIDWC